MCDVVLGSQWGDEGKGKLVDLLCDDIDVCARCQGGNNAGHTIVVGKVKYDFHMLPSGLVNPKCQNLVGSGVVIHVPSFFAELENLEAKGLDCRDRLFVSSRAHLVFDFHQRTDKLKEAELSTNKKSIGTTGKGIGPTYSTKASRSGIRVHHLVNPDPEAWEEFKTRYLRLVESRQKRYGEFEYDPKEELARFEKYRETLRPFVVDSVNFMHEAIAANKKILVEGANALMLDIDFGTYPYVTSSSTGIGGVLTGLGIPPRTIRNVYGVVKAYTTRVGEGPFPTEQLNKVGETLQDVGAEYGVTTGRKRRCGWLDLVVLKYSNSINGYTSLNITKLDVLDKFKEIEVGVAYKLNGKELPSFPEDLIDLAKVEVVYKKFPGWEQDITGIKKYEDLPENAKNYLKFIEDYLQVPIQWVGTGPARDSMLEKKI
ncbi:adenylosuccinate synthetase [Candida albicans P57072]|uniref:Adenylosuccinate synthetase n=3 Tax=Candida albicans TaxID=5476 RepID=PURA_CANAL|nr:adenylosuccinate synthase [Candida albicans SC5314]P0CH96.1 RecName: Full=Adenylosuccinate synthetase; Short=AMPSase; Short=AdSS; AltName: Full=IMP--aspartate ligase [Candida albicans SC5314]P0CH97.1 RecName: Full=Adenylosuccinate synthetase; Short=AMPSase; Short=AdSS; AltName: Full=IMP--aspartate ligase [Candida albicans WO-1]KGQ90622.1 adenylosuccinate synthetase [Candida albicans P94015]KGQ97949.1 adenylosuccinate synthetase [Candida albicans P37005]KGR02695.1 adenylosuccinate synthetase|eukprot:XP_723513.1 adenylosuccinate synthase [Candida albicans SC5314]